jgi:menaquinone-dependent protoporphyrinogen oxidase
MLHPRDHRVFFGAWDRGNKPIGFLERVVRLMPAARASMPDGDLRDWPKIESWADGIGVELRTAAATSTGSR